MIRFQPNAGQPLAIDPRAIGALFLLPPSPQVEMRDGVAIVPIRGPLMHHAGGLFDSYEGIKGRVAQALTNKPKAVVLSIDSPGGECSGCIEAAEEIRGMCDAAGVPLVSYVEGRACSAGYALACAAQEIVAQPSAIIGSIGAVTELVDSTKLDAALGLKYEVVASGDRKLDGNQHVEISDGARLATKAIIGGLAEQLFAHVAMHRPITADEARALDAGLVLAAKAAETRGLVDTIDSLPSLVARFAGANAATGGEEGTNMSTLAETQKALQAIADDEKADEKERAKARSALKAMEGEGEGNEEPEDETEPEARVSGNPGASADATSALVARLDRIEAAERTREINAVIATRPDITAEQRTFAATLATADAATKYLATIPKQARRNPAADVQPGMLSPELRVGQVPEGAGVSAQERELDVRMGLSVEGLGIKRDAHTLTLGAISPQAAAKMLAEKEKVS